MTRFGYLRATAIVLVLLTAGCDYRQILSFKKQLREPERYFELHSNERCVFVFKEPVFSIAGLKGADVKPSREIAGAKETNWYFNFFRNERGVNAFSFAVIATFEDGMLKRISFPGSVPEFVGNELLAQFLVILGHSSIDLKQRRTVFDAGAGPQLRYFAPARRSRAEELFGSTRVVPDPSQRSETLVYRYRGEGRGTNTTPTVEARLKFRRPLGVFDSGVLRVGRSVIRFDDRMITIVRL